MTKPIMKEKRYELPDEDLEGSEADLTPKQPASSPEQEKEDKGNVHHEPNNGYNVDAEYDEEYQKELEKEEKFQEIIDYILDSDLMSIKKLNGSSLDTSQLRTWEEKYGKIYVSKVTEDPVIYIWKPLFRLEYLKLIGTGDNDGETNWNDNHSRQMGILKKCLLFPEPSPEFIAKGRAGILDTLESQIMYQSGFVSEQQALSSINVIG